LVAPRRKKIKPRGFALTALLSNVSPPTNSIWAHLKRMVSSALPIGGAAVSTRSRRSAACWSTVGSSIIHPYFRKFTLGHPISRGRHRTSVGFAAPNRHLTSCIDARFCVRPVSMAKDRDSDCKPGLARLAGPGGPFSIAGVFCNVHLSAKNRTFGVVRHPSLPSAVGSLGLARPKDREAGCAIKTLHQTYLWS